MELDPDLRDGSGLPGAKVVYTTSENSRRLLDFHVERAAESLRGRGRPRRHAGGDAKRRLAPPRHSANGSRPGVVGRRPLGEGARRRQPLRRRRQRLRDLGRREPDQLDLPRSPCASPTVSSHGAPTSGCLHDVGGSGERGSPAALGTIADGLMPPADGMPAPSSLDISGRQLDAVVSSRSDFVTGLCRALDAAGDAHDPIAWVESLRMDDPTAYEALDGRSPLLPASRGQASARLSRPGRAADECRRIPRLRGGGPARARLRAGPIYRPTPPPDRDRPVGEADVSGPS